MVDFVPLINIPIAEQYRSMMLLSFKISLIIPSQKMSISSIKRKWEMKNLSHVCPPLKAPTIFYYIRDLLRPLTTIRKNNGDKGQPCLRPLPTLKNLDVYPFINTKNETVVIQLITPKWKEPQTPSESTLNEYKASSLRHKILTGLFWLPLPLFLHLYTM